MKKLVSFLALSLAFVLSAQAQKGLGSLGNILSNAASTVYSAPVSLDGSYKYNGAAISATSSEGGVLTNLAGTAVTSGMETKADEYLAKVGIKPGAMNFTFNSADNTFTLNVGSLSLPGTYKVSSGEKVVTLTFGKSLQFFSMSGVLQSHMNGAKMLFPADKAMAFIKKLAAKMGENASQVAGLAKLADGYDNYKIGFKLSK